MMHKERLIFIVDDDPVINMLVVKRFSSRGFTMEAFESGEECLDALRKNPDLIILDYLFPNSKGRKLMDGLEVFGKIKEYNPALPVIILSGQDKGDVVLELARKGVDNYIIKDKDLIDNLNDAISEIFGH